MGKGGGLPNIATYYNKFDEIEHYLLNNLIIVILALTESRIAENISDEELKINDFDLVRYDSESSFTSSVTVYVHCTVNFFRLK